MKTKSYIVKSARKRSKNPNVCRMDIRVEKLNEAVEESATYYFTYHHGEGDTYMYSYIYSYPADKLRDCFREKHVSINSNGNKYELYLNYIEGAIYRSDKCTQFVLKLNSDGEGKTVYSEEFKNEYSKLLSRRKK